MNLVESTWMALTALAANKGRSALTMLGVIIGVGAVIALVSTGKGAQMEVLSSLERMGTNLVFAIKALDVPAAQPLTMDDAGAVARLPYVETVVPQIGGFMKVTYQAESSTSNVFGTTPEYSWVHNADVALGRFITQADEDTAARVAVVGLQTADDLGTRNLLGRNIYISGLPFTVVGLLEPRGSTGFLNRDQMVLIPLSTAISRVTGDDSIYYLSARVTERDRIPDVQRSMGTLLRDRHRIGPDDQDDFLLMKQTDLQDMMGLVTNVFTALAGGIAAISLLVGGIGIMNIMLVSVTERTREIGIRKAIGARRRDILAQFLVESIILSLFGGILGIGFGVLLAWAAESVLRFHIGVTPSAVALAFAVSVGIGVFFGVYPAWRAGSQDPIDALRYE